MCQMLAQAGGDSKNELSSKTAEFIIHYLSSGTLLYSCAAVVFFRLVAINGLDLVPVLVLTL